MFQEKVQVVPSRCLPGPRCKTSRRCIRDLELLTIAENVADYNDFGFIHFLDIYSSFFFFS